MTENQDQILTCRECRQTFVFSLGEQKFFADKGFQPPKRCDACLKRERDAAAVWTGGREP
jgi:hypothetical protein